MNDNKQSPFRVSIRLVSNNNSLLAKADVMGKIMNINGLSVMAGRDGKEPWVSEPSIRQGSGWLKVVEITDKSVKEAISKAVLEAYNKAIADRPPDNFNEDEPGF